MTILAILLFGVGPVFALIGFATIMDAHFRAGIKRHTRAGKQTPDPHA